MRCLALALLVLAGLLPSFGCSSSFWDASNKAESGQVDTSDTDTARERRHQRTMKRYAEEAAKKGV